MLEEGASGLNADCFHIPYEIPKSDIRSTGVRLCFGSVQGFVCSRKSITVQHLHLNTPVLERDDIIDGFTFGGTSL